MAEAMNAGNLAWLDLEMTGLNVETDVIIQAALIITDADLNMLGTEVVDIWQPEEMMRQMTPFVRDMHTSTGLLDRVSKSKFDLKLAERKLMALMTQFCPYPATLCGNSVGTDKRFVERWMPGFAGYLHYQILDVSSFKLVAKRYYSNKMMFQKSAEGAHDALVDIENSIAEFAHYRAHMLKPA